MTRTEWLEETSDFDSLIAWCKDNGYENCVEDIISGDDLDDYIQDDIRYSDYGWVDLRDCLNNIDSGWDWYRVDGTFDYTGLDEYDMERIHDEILESLEENDFFDEEDEEESDPPTVQTPASDTAPDEEPELEEVELDCLSDLSESAWGWMIGARKPEPEPEVQTEPDTMAVDLDALPF